jgi:hypothetical protein
LAARLSKELGRPVSRKLVQHAFRIMGWTIPQMTKKQLIGAMHEKPKPTAINQDWETDLTFIWCGINDRMVLSVHLCKIPAVEPACHPLLLLSNGDLLCCVSKSLKL